MTKPEVNSNSLPAAEKPSEQQPEKKKRSTGTRKPRRPMLWLTVLYVLFLVGGSLLIWARSRTIAPELKQSPPPAALLVPCGEASGSTYVAARELTANHRVGSEDLQPVVALPDGAAGAASKTQVVGKYTRSKVEQGALVTPEDLAILPRFDLAGKRETFLVPIKADHKTIEAFPSGSVVHLYSQEKVVEKGEILAVVCAPPGEEAGEGGAGTCWFVLAVPQGRAAELLVGECKQFPLTLRKE